MSLTAMVTAILADSIIDAGEVIELREEIMADGIVDANEVGALFKLNDATVCENHHPSFQSLFVESIVAHVMADGVIDEDEIILLVNGIQGDGVVDANELELLTVLKEANGGTLPGPLEALLPQ